MNVVKFYMRTYKPSLDWLHLHALKKEEFIRELNPIQGISFEETNGGVGLTMDQKNSVVTDKVAEFDLLHKVEVDHFKKTISLCVGYLELVKYEHRDLIKHWMETQATLAWLAAHYYGTPQGVEKIINRETLRISNERVDLSTKIT